jgi:predicted amidophosphoribosyltransferase
VPVPTSRRRTLARGFDPAATLASSLGAATGLPVERCLRRRRGGARQVGRTRRERLGSPPQVIAVGAAPPSAVLVDDVLTTGATLSACAAALRRAGAIRVVALTFARRP